VHERARVLKYLRRKNPSAYETLLVDIGVERGAVEGEIIVR
jgi:small subunit ribosomal protein S15